VVAAALHVSHQQVMPILLLNDTRVDRNSRLPGDGHLARRRPGACDCKPRDDATARGWVRLTDLIRDGLAHDPNAWSRAVDRCQLIGRLPPSSNPPITSSRTSRERFITTRLARSRLIALPSNTFKIEGVLEFFDGSVPLVRDAEELRDALARVPTSVDIHQIDACRRLARLNAPSARTAVYDCASTPSVA
jgi:hypothetical protein